MTEQEKQKKSNVVLWAAVAFNLSIGILYAWGMFRSKLTAAYADGGWEWSMREAGLPYTLIIVFFALGVLIGGRVQDKTGPRPVLITGGLMVGLGMLLSGLVGNNPIGIAICYGVISGLGIGFGYSCGTPTTLKWFHPSRKGYVSGMVLGGFGLAAVYVAPLTNTLLQRITIQQTFYVMGIIAIILSMSATRFIVNPPAGYIPVTPKNMPPAAKNTAPPPDFTWKEMMRTRRFYIIIILFLCSASVGQMIIGSVPIIARDQAGLTSTAIMAALLSYTAIMNGVGRIAGGIMSDKIGRVNALFVVFLLQLINISAFTFYQNMPLVIVGITATGLCFGAILSIFPALSADQYGLKNYGLNYGIIYLAWGSAGLLAPVIADYFFDLKGNFYTAYIICAIMMVVILGVNGLLKMELKKTA